jgi:hypothetical protein
MKERDHPLHTLAELRTLQVERARAEAVRVRRGLAERNAALAELSQAEHGVSEASQEARREGAEAADVTGLRAAAELLRGLRHDQEQLEKRRVAAEHARAALLEQQQALEQVLVKAELGQRAVANELNKSEHQRAREREQREDDERDALSAAPAQAPRSTRRR